MKKITQKNEKKNVIFILFFATSGPNCMEEAGSNMRAQFLMLVISHLQNRTMVLSLCHDEREAIQP